MTRLLLAAVAVASALAAQSEAAGSARSCPVTIPGPARGSGFEASGFNYGNDKLRVAIYWPRGTLRAGRLPDGGSYATIDEDGAISAKVGWYRGEAGTVRITGQRLDRTAPRLRAHVPDGYGPLGFQPSGITFPTVGCWRVTGRVGSGSLTFVVKVEKIKSRKRFR
jgi:hypothetical protein